MKVLVRNMKTMYLELGILRDVRFFTKPQKELLDITFYKIFY